MKKLFNQYSIFLLLSIIISVLGASCEKLINDRQPVSDAFLIKLSLNGEDIQIPDDGEIVLPYEKGKSLKNMVINYIISTGATMSPDIASGSTIDLSEPIEIIITSMDGSTTKEYKIVPSLVDNQISRMFIKYNGNEFDADINQNKGEIILYVPHEITDYSTLKPEFVIAEGATSSISSGSSIDLSNGKEQIIIISNQGIEKSYTIKAIEFSLMINSFKVNLGGIDYMADIDQVAHTVKLHIPYKYAVTSLIPDISFSEGADLSPAIGTTLDFSVSHDYTLSALGTSVMYEVSVSNEPLVGFLSAWTSPSQIKNKDENVAYQWFHQTYPDGDFLSTVDIRDHNVDLNFYKVIWWHNDEYMNLPQSALDIAQEMKDFYLGGGGLFLTTFANKYLGILGIPKDGKSPDIISQDNEPVQYVWGQGISINGHLTHPIFSKNVTVTNFGDGIDRVYMVFDNTWRKEKQAMWSVGSAAYSDINDWRSKTGGIDLAGFEWQGDRSAGVTMAEFPANNKGQGEGPVISLGALAYDWNVDHEGENDYVANAPYMIENIKNITKNTIDYLMNQ